MFTGRPCACRCPALKSAPGPPTLAAGPVHGNSPAAGSTPDVQVVRRPHGSGLLRVGGVARRPFRNAAGGGITSAVTNPPHLPGPRDASASALAPRHAGGPPSREPRLLPNVGPLGVRDGTTVMLRAMSALAVARLRVDELRETRRTIQLFGARRPSR
jgi:hypothetical protein